MKKCFFFLFLFVFLFFSTLKAQKQKQEQEKPKVNDLPLLYYKLKVDLKPEKSFLNGELNINFSPQKQAFFLLDKRAIISKISTEIKETRIDVIKTPEKIHEILAKKIDVLNLELKDIKMYRVYHDEEKVSFSNLTIKYKILFKEYRRQKQFDFLEENKNYTSPEIINKESIFFTSDTLWFPFFPGPKITFKLKAQIPNNYSLVSEGISSESTKGFLKQYFFDSLHPVNFINLIGGIYQINETKYKGIDIKTLFYLHNDRYAVECIELAKKLIDKYQTLFGAYPYLKLVFLENSSGIIETIHSIIMMDKKNLPSLNLQKFLARRISQVWWGNAVSVDKKEGDWSKGLSFLYSDYMIEEEQGQGKSFRFQILKDYFSFIDSSNDMPINQITNYSSKIGKTIGYGKSMFVFYMLRNLMGKETFENALKSFYNNYKFKTATFTDFQRTMENVYGKSLYFFFNQWIKRKGAPEFNIEFLNLLKRGYDYIVDLKFNQLQQTEPFSVFAPSTIVAEDQTSANHWFELNKHEQTKRISLNKKPISIHLDPGYKIFRKLKKEEVPPSISLFLGNNKINIKNLNSSFNRKIANQFPNKNISSDSNKIIVVNPDIRIIKEKLKNLNFKIKKNKIKIDDFYYNLRELNVLFSEKEENAFYLLIYSSNFDFPQKIVSKIANFDNYGLVIWDNEFYLLKNIEFLPKQFPLKIRFN